jgi:ribonuclease R
VIGGIILNNEIKEQILAYLTDIPVNKAITKLKLESDLKISKVERKIFENSIKELKKENIVHTTKKKGLMINKNIKFIIGTFFSNCKGYGFVVSQDESIQDLFIPQSKVNNALHKDRVVVKIIKRPENNKRAEGEIISVLSRQLESIIGTYMANETFGFVIPDNNKINRDIYIPQGCSNGANSYDKVVCQITKYPERDRKPEGEITEIIGVKWDKGVDVLSIIKDNNIKSDFPPKVIKFVDKIPEVIKEEELKRRENLTDLKIFTIDGEDAKDLDDAVSIKKLDNGNYQLGVHIADVSHYVKENSVIDKEALERATSVYLIDTVIPMLPKKLSNNLCSLNPNTIKLTLSVFMDIDKHGVVVNHRICESFINTVARLNYTEVSDFLENNDTSFKEKYPFLLEDIKIMEELAKVLMKKRNDRGAIDFDFPEAKIILNEDGKVKDITKYDRRISNKIIEEFMLVCNETVAEIFFLKELPFVYRVHENPRIDKLEEFREFIKEYGYYLPEDCECINSIMLQDILNEVKGKKMGQAFNLVLLKTMQQARYSPICNGHFGLSTSFYCHFTSPIRRYPDLQIHRIIKESLHGELSVIRKEHLEEIVKNSSKISSRRERVAEQAENELHTIKKLEFMEDKIGQVYEGIVTGFNSIGIFITLENTAEGILKIDKIKDDNYELDRKQFSFIGKSTNQKIMIGDKILISVNKVDVDCKEMLFDFISK